MGYRIAVDTGGTFTDMVLLDEDDRFRVGKALTTPDRISEGMFAALDVVAETVGQSSRDLLANTDILIRTFLMLLAFAWFTNQGARLGDATLAANHVLLQLIMFSAFFMDGFAFAAESLIGRAVGAGDRARFERSVRISSQWSALTALALAATILIAGDAIIALLTDLPAVRDAARLYLLWCALYVACSFAAFQFDGIFIGATRTRDLRNAAIISVALFAPLGVFGTQHFGNHGLWASFVAYVLLRAVTLWRRYPALRAEFSDG